MADDKSLGRFAEQVRFRRERRRRLGVYLNERSRLLREHGGAWVALVDGDRFLFGETHGDLMARVAGTGVTESLVLIRYLAPNALAGSLAGSRERMRV